MGVAPAQPTPPPPPKHPPPPPPPPAPVAPAQPTPTHPPKHAPTPHHHQAAGERRSDDSPKALDEFCRDLCAEVARVTQILARRTKNNPILLGEPGVGKTAIAEGLARAIVAGAQADGTPLPAFLAGKRVMQLDVGLLIAGAKVCACVRVRWALSHVHPPHPPTHPPPTPSQERGELESRVTKLLAESKAAGNVILVIDEARERAALLLLLAAADSGVGPSPDSLTPPPTVPPHPPPPSFPPFRCTRSWARARWAAAAATAGAASTSQTCSSRVRRRGVCSALRCERHACRPTTSLARSLARSPGARRAAVHRRHHAHRAPAVH